MCIRDRFQTVLPCSLVGEEFPALRSMWSKGSLALMSDILATALEVEPTDYNIWRATRHSSDGTELAKRLLEVYLEAELPPVPLKAPHEFRPAFLSDYAGNQETPYDREFVFVNRALCYADSVAIVDELSSWAYRYERDPEPVRVDWVLGFPDCNNGTWAARRISRYRQLEEDGLIFYVDPPVHRTRNEIAAMLNWELVSPLGKLVARRMGYTPSVAKDSQVILSELVVWFREFFALLEHVGKFRDNLDLYLPSWFAGPELLDWWYKTGNAILPDQVEALTRHKYLTQLLMLPAFTADACLDLTHSELVAIRDDAAFGLWRSDLEDALRVLTDTSDVFSSAEYKNLLGDRAETLGRRLGSSRTIAPKFGDTLVTGVTTALVAGGLGQDLFPPVALGTAPVAALLLLIYNPGIHSGESLIAWVDRCGHAVAGMLQGLSRKASRSAVKTGTSCARAVAM